MCLYPKLIKNPKYRMNKKNGGIVPELIDVRCGMVPIGCKKCIECRKQKAGNWRVRLSEELRHDSNGIFVTFTFSNDSIRRLVRKVEQEDGVSPTGYGLDNAIAIKAIRYFLENWRNRSGKSVKHWFITELGHEGTENIHLHGIVWSKNVNEIRKVWNWGWVYFGYSFNEKGVNYFTKYVQKIDVKNKDFEGRILCSAGLGRKYVERWDAKRNSFKEFGSTDELYVNRQGYRMALPVYWRNKLYSEEEREKLWIEKLDKGVRFVLGTEIDITTEQGIDLYYVMLDEARLKNKRLGYGNDEVNWSQREYDNSRRELLIRKRIEDDKGVEYFDVDTGELLC